MPIARRLLLGALLLGASSAWQPAWGISMPLGSTVWMKFESGVGPDADGDDIAGSNQAGPAPPNGIPLTTLTAGAASATGYAEILPGSIRTFLTATNTDGFLFASFQDTYTVGGVAAGPFDVTVQLHVTGVVRSVPLPPFGHGFILPNVVAEIGTFSPISEIGGVPLSEGFRVTPFDAGSTATVVFGTETAATPFEHPVDLMPSHTFTGMNVGDVFDVAYGVNSAFGRGEIDLLDTAIISFTLPDGVFLTSALAANLPEPPALGLGALGALACAGVARRRRSGAPTA